MGRTNGMNIVAYSGGVDSSLVALLVHRAFPSNSMACLGVSASLPSEQLKLARGVAAHIGIALREVTPGEGVNPEYVANQGQSCYHCKAHLYTALEVLAAAVGGEANMKGARGKLSLFNGTNSDDTKDATRVGLAAAKVDLP